MYMTAFGGDVYVKRAPKLYERGTTVDDGHFMQFISDVTASYSDWVLEKIGNFADNDNQVKIRFNNKDNRREDLMETCKDFYDAMTKHSGLL